MAARQFRLVVQVRDVSSPGDTGLSSLIPWHWHTLSVSEPVDASTSDGTIEAAVETATERMWREISDDRKRLSMTGPPDDDDLGQYYVLPEQAGLPPITRPQPIAFGFSEPSADPPMSPEDLELRRLAEGKPLPPNPGREFRASLGFAEPRYGTCGAYAKRGTGTGICDRPLDEHGNCDRPGDHIE